MTTISRSFLAGMKGLTLEAMKGLVSTGRANGKLNLCFDGERWVLVYRPPGGKRNGWVNESFYLKSEKSGKARRFARADTALRIAARMLVMSGIWVDLRDTTMGFTNPDAQPISDATHGPFWG